MQPAGGTAAFWMSRVQFVAPEDNLNLCLAREFIR
ncbi:hypothetical protein FHS20_002830 [Phyllobacterium endophyticum]|nr:hypothetical protein [Phyllobacterium endophyticum]